MSFFKALKKNELSFYFYYYDGYINPYYFDSEISVPENIKDILFEITTDITQKHNINELWSDSETYKLELKIKPNIGKLFLSVRCENYETQNQTYSDDIRLDSMLEFLKEKEIESVKVEYDGYGDSGEISQFGQINGIDSELYWGGEYEPLLIFLYDKLESAYGGWELDDGSKGEIEIEKHYGTTMMITIYHKWQVRVWENCLDDIDITNDLLEK